MSADPFPPERIAELRRRHNGAMRNGKWREGLSSHHTVADPTPEYANGYPVAEFKHASNAELCDDLMQLLPAALDAIERLRARDQRREQLLQECLAYVEPTGPSPSCQSLAAKIRAELEGGA